MKRKKIPSLAKSDAPFLPIPNDPAFRDAKKVNRGKTIKYLTIPKKGSIIERVNKLKRKDNKMASNKTNKSTAMEAVKTAAWLVEAAFRGFVGWIMLANFDHYATTVVAVYALGTAGIIVVMHFFKAHN